MKKIIILAIATLSTGIVLSSSLKKTDAVVKPAVVAPIVPQKEDVTNLNKHAANTSYDVVSTAD